MLLICLIFFIGLIIAWILVGEWNVLHQQWLVPLNGTIWYGKLTDSNKQWLWNNYAKYTGYDDINVWFDKWGNKNCQIINNIKLLFNNKIIIILSSCFIGTFIIPIVFRFFKFIEIDAIPFIATLVITMIWLILSGMINQKIGAWLWIIRIFVCLILIFVCFITLNAIINSIMMRLKIGENITNDYLISTKDVDTSTKEIDSMINQTKQSDITEIEK